MTDQPKHTPGPWEAREVDGLFAIAHPTGWVLESGDVEQNRVDAALIARAPELLEENARLLKRVNDLETAIANGMNDAARMVDRNGWLESEHQRLKQENERLRGLLRECIQPGNVKATCDLIDRIKAELGSE